MPKKIEYYRPPGSYPGTPRPSGGYSKERQADYDRTAKRQADHAFYNSAAWRKLRAMKLRESPLCERCEAEGQIVAASIVHHRKERHDHPDLAFDLDNLESLCQRHHSSHHSFGNGDGKP